jgi:hypothetical protein
VGSGAFVGPHVAGEPVWAEDVGGHPFQVGRGHAGGLQCFTDDRGPVGSVFGQGLAGPVAGDQDTTAADAEVFSIMSLAGTAAGAGPVGLDAERNQFAHRGEQGSQRSSVCSRSMCASRVGSDSLLSPRGSPIALVRYFAR